MSQQAYPAGSGDVIGAADPQESFEDFVGACSGRLFTMALLLTGYNRIEAEDLLQGVLERACRRWRRICRAGEDPAPYVRKMLVNASVDRWRRLRRRQEGPLNPADADPVTSDEFGLVADRDLLLRAMATLPVGQRAVLVLRYFEDLTEAQAAAALGCRTRLQRRLGEKPVRPGARPAARGDQRRRRGRRETAGRRGA